ncbi:hypothetical protein COB57_04460 [Candidatus Peregrinibacteria bacterium]|nr:MAG: hypothetical protein COB57_04460 [Candidatus Peregrinibacteria bacterium]
MNIYVHVQKKLKEISPEYIKDINFEDVKMTLQPFEDFYKKSNAIYAEHEKYDLHWAFKDSQKNIHLSMSQLIADINAQYKICKYRNVEVSNTISDIQKILIGHETKIKHWVRFYDIGSFFVTFIDIIISLILILMVTKIGKFGETIFDTGLIATLFVSLVAFLKISLDRFYIIPKVHAWGWKLYKKITSVFLQDTATMLALSFIIKAIIKNHKEQDLAKIFHKSEDLMEG